MRNKIRLLFILVFVIAALISNFYFDLKTEIKELKETQKSITIIMEKTSDLLVQVSGQRLPEKCTELLIYGKSACMDMLGRLDPNCVRKVWNDMKDACGVSELEIEL